MVKSSPFRYFKTSPEIIRLAVMLYVWFPLSLRNVKDLLHERGIDVSYETVHFWWNRFGPIYASDIKPEAMQGVTSSLLGDCYAFTCQAAEYIEFFYNPKRKHARNGMLSPPLSDCMQSLASNG